MKPHRLRQVLEGLCHGGIRCLRLTDAEGQVRLEVTRDPEPQGMAYAAREIEASVIVMVNAVPVAGVQAVGPQEKRQTLEGVAEMAASRLSEVWASAEEIESLAGELVRTYEELHLLYELSEALAGELTAAAAADIILERILGTVRAAWAELTFTTTYGQVYAKSGRRAGSENGKAGGEEQRLESTLRSRGQVVGNIVLARPADGQPFSSHDSKLLDAVGTLAGNAIRNAQLYEELHRQAEALRESESHLRAVLDNVADGIITLDEAGTIQSFNAAAERIFGVTAAEVTGGDFRTLVPESSYQEYRSRLRKYLHSRAPKTISSGPYETLGQRKDGSTIPMEVTISGMNLDSKQLFIVSVRDVTERKQAEETLQRTERLRALGQLASGVAHDLNQALGLIAGYSDLAVQALDRPPLELDELRKALQLVAQAAMDGAETVKRLLLFSRAKPEGERQRLELSSLLQEVAQLTAPRWRDATQMEGRPVTLKTTASGETVITGWPAGLKEAFTNLVLNSVDALPRGGSISLDARREGDRVHVLVADDGIGMSPEVQARIFEPFFSTKGVRGTGMGLAMVFGIVERHEGTISVESVVGHGTVFHLTFPAATAATVPAQNAAPVEAKPRQLRVLAVDDEPTLGQMVAGILSPEGHVVDSVTSGEDALARLEQQPFDLVLSDLGMGEGMNGWELAEQVHQRWPEIRFILVTGWGAQIDPAEAATRGVDGIIAKPFRATQLRQLIAAQQPTARPASS